MHVPRRAAAIFLTVVLCANQLPLAAAFAVEIPHQANRYRNDLTRSARLVWGMDAPVATFAAQIHQESLWKPQAVSRVGALGMAQFMPATARWWCEINKLSPEQCQPTNPAWALRALVGYDQWLWARISGARTACDRMHYTLRAYNGGLGYIKREIKYGKTCTTYRAGWACRENLAYPRRILNELEPVYAVSGWGNGSCG